MSLIALQPVLVRGALPGMAGLAWRRLHLAFGAVIAAGTVGHALLILGTMETVSKWALSLLVLTAVGWAIRGELRR